MHSNTISHRVILIYFTLLFFCPYITFSQVEAQEKIDSLEKALNSKIPINYKVPILIQLSDIYEDRNLNLSKSYINKALDISNSTNDKRLLLDSKLQLIQVFLKEDEYYKAEYLADECLKTHKNILTEIEVGTLYKAKSFLYTKIAQYDKAIDYAFQSLELLIKKKDTNGVFDSYNTIAEILYYQKEFSKSLKYMQDAYEYCRKHNLYRKEVFARANIGSLYWELEDWKNAKINIIESINLANKFGLYSVIGTSYLNLSKVYIHFNDIKSELQCYDHAFNAFKNLGNDINIARVLIKYSGYYLNVKNDYNRALNYAYKAYNIGSKKQSVFTLQESSSLISHIYEKKMMYNEAYRFLKIYHALNDSVTNKTLKTKIEIEEIKYKYNQDIRQNQLSKRSYYYLRTVYAILLIISIIVLLIIFYISKQKIIKLFSILTRSKNAIHDEKSNIMTLQITDVKSQDVLKKLVDKVKLITLADPSLNNQMISIINNLENSIKLNDLLLDKINTTNTKSDFISNLQVKHPELTENELKICFYLKLNLSTKEISELIGQKVSNITISRFRIRKKMGLNNSKVNIVTYLNKI